MRAMAATVVIAATTASQMAFDIGMHYSLFIPPSDVPFFAVRVLPSASPVVHVVSVFAATGESDKAFDCALTIKCRDSVKNVSGG
jgi:hypothetical protein